MRVCVFGSSGFLGSSVAHELDVRGVSWVGVNANSKLRKRDFLLSEIDLENLPAEISSCDYFVNAAGGWKPKTAEAFPEEALSSMIGLAEVTIQLAVKSNAKKILHISSAGTVYGELRDCPHSEVDQPAPLSWYGRGKLLEENYYQRKCIELGLDFVCARVSNPFGNDKKTNHGLVDVLISACKNKADFMTYRDADPSRDFIYAPDMAFYIVSLLLGPQVGVFNVGAGVSHSTKEILDFVRAGYGFSEIKATLSRPKFDVIKNEIDVSKLIEAVGRRETIDLFSYIRDKLDAGHEVRIA